MNLKLGNVFVLTWIRNMATAIVVLLMIPYVSGWLAVAAWIIFGWHCLGVLVDLIILGQSINKINAAVRKARR